MVTIEQVRTGPVSVLAVGGEIDLGSAPRLRAVLDEVLDGPGAWPITGVVLDLTAVAFLGSAGLAVLVDAHERAAQQRIALTLVIGGAGSPVARVLQSAGLDEHLHVHRSVTTALAAVEGPRPA